MNKKLLSPFKQALMDAQLEKWKDIPGEDEINLELSEAFQRKSRALIRQESRTGIKKMCRSVRRTVLIAASLAALLIVTFSISAGREKSGGLQTNNEGVHYEFTLDPEIVASAPKRIKKVYKPTYIPKGFREDGVIAEEWVVYQWEADASKTITFGQYPLSNESVRPQPNTEGAKVEQFSLNGYQVLCINSADNRMYFWTDNVYFYRLISSSAISKEECDKVFCSITENKNVIIAMEK